MRLRTDCVNFGVIVCSWHNSSLHLKNEYVRRRKVSIYWGELICLQNTSYLVLKCYYKATRSGLYLQSILLSLTLCTHILVMWVHFAFHVATY